MTSIRAYSRRITGLRHLLSDQGVDALLVIKREDVRYLTGFSGSAGVVLINARKVCLITDFRYQVQARRETSGIQVLIQKKDQVSAIADTVVRYDMDTVWFEESALTVEGLKKLKKQGLKLKGCGDLIGGLRERKDAAELASIRRAVQRAEDSFRKLTKQIKAGVTERELAFRLEYLMREQGARKAAFDTIVASGPNGAMPHASITDRRIRKGDLVTFDFGAEADGYYSDMTRTVCIGSPTPRQRRLYDLVLSAQQAAVSRVLPGVTCKSIDDAARSVIEKAGFGKEFGHGTGHGIGLMVHERPSVSRLSKDRVTEGMVFTVEPGIYIDGWGGIRIEDMVLAEKGGVNMLTSLPRDLSILS